MEIDFTRILGETMSSHSPERRRSERLHLQIPIFLRGLDPSGTEFLELTKTVDISATGALVLSRRSFHPDQLLRITIPVSSATQLIQIQMILDGSRLSRDRASDV
jgi:hypothetical protein